MDLDMIIQILRLDGEQQRPEPLKRPKVTANPEEIHLAQARLALRVIHAVPDTLQNRSERSHTDTGAHEDSDLKLEHVFGRGTERAVNVDARQNSAQTWVDAGFVYTLNDRLVFLALLVEFAAQGLG